MNIEEEFENDFNNNLDLSRYAEEFCEGDNILKETLLNLWKNGIKTKACCKGHSNDKFDVIPYILFSFDDNSSSFIKVMFNSLASLAEGVSYNISLRRESEIINFEVYMRGNSKDSTLKFMSTIADKTKQKSDNNLYDYINYLLDFSKKEGLGFEFDINSKSMTLFFKNDKETEYSEHMPLLSEVVSNHDDLPYFPVLCDEQSIGMFVESLKQRNIKR